ncbi:2-oxo-4-hydroxy-4-carboxy-5-ureidoimidazoline decarboxylase [Nocardioides campestrisoli]|uniref:2-oxo-4-hydroxy-4-carboxy-5-ureidoimidazoline decarboxylase n=1 Tax=Nocardioides campestrisoli TaxID=2736757 RepID=UPI00163DD825|nr:2-oxo-4-hydroxy-4-carboxy-5-ureidoimidazoline decarboxylase [Nocardioides campestrisoli]
MRIDELNDLDPAEAGALLRTCADVDSWVRALVDARPYASAAALLDQARTLAAGWTGAEVEAALADHPRIGDRHPGGASAELSAREQSGVDREDEELQRRLRAGNRAYEERFGRIFLVRAAGRSAAEILALLEERLGHDPATELEVTSGQLAEIALLRLEGLLS